MGKLNTAVDVEQKIALYKTTERRLFTTDIRVEERKGEERKVEVSQRQRRKGRGLKR